MANTSSPAEPTVDVVVVGAGFAGLYALYRLRAQGLSVRVYEAGSDVGGTWYWNRYPGARCDVESVDYSYSFSDELQQEWDWTEKYASQPEILRYVRHVADRFDLRRDICFDTRVRAAHLDEDAMQWTVQSDRETVTARYCVFATGALSTAMTPDIPGLEEFAGETHHTGHWPHDGVDFAGKRVGVIGTGSSGIQSIPIIAASADQVFVFQRSANYSVPAGNTAIDARTRARVKANYAERRRLSRESGGGSPYDAYPKKTLEADPAERRAAFEARWQLGGVLFGKTFPDQTTDPAANDEAKAFVEAKIREIVADTAVAELLTPKDHPIGTKRICTDTDYYRTFNRDNVTLVDLRSAPIVAIDAHGVVTTARRYDLDVLIFATGFDAMTGSLDRIDIRGRAATTLRDAWKDGPRTYLGLGVDGFPNMFVVTGPGSPSVLANMVLGAEQHVDWIADCLAYVDEHGCTAIEATPEAVDDWVAECNERAAATLFPVANSWYLGANIPGKPRVFMPFIGGFGAYGNICAEVAAAGYKGFSVMAGDPR
ncbi:NAD(P)/FAD-dependent oxidoreductase [Antrihabitans sp. YC2-6]|uniref:flavin-containing monooxygenase n=1 Tax=Antrihabitans sp. YC2-6 TaxID=2799498 RepID=UPI0018F2CB60|nr:NAD(P)/FAD-dependent oxidoreductase [Antrihabitans sp. YC2-6]MBJ8344698.1 NAD(P)/FAD-dependent oxidoreductase [Antrihabitans sp. YC2-6]